MDEFVQLPNKDLWRGYRDAPSEQALAEIKQVPDYLQDPTNKAMAEMLKMAAGSNELTCMWCGQQFDERRMRKHITEQHPSKTKPETPADESAMLMARLAELEKNKKTADELAE